MLRTTGNEQALPSRQLQFAVPARDCQKMGNLSFEARRGEVGSDQLVLCGGLCASACGQGKSVCALQPSDHCAHCTTILVPRLLWVHEPACSVPAPTHHFSASQCRSEACAKAPGRNSTTPSRSSTSVFPNASNIPRADASS
jgi:hypothetical protein